MNGLESLLRNGAGTGLKVALDVEGVLADISNPVIRMYNNIHGTNWQLRDIKDWGFQSINADAKEMLGLFNRVWIERPGEVYYEGDTGLLVSLKRICQLEIVTSRTGADVQLKNFLEGAGLQNFTLVINPPTREKTELNYNVYIDDSPVLAEKVIKSDGKVILLVDRPWNRDVPKSDNVIRMPNVNSAATRIMNEVRQDSRRRATA